MFIPHSCGKHLGLGGYHTYHIYHIIYHIISPNIYSIYIYIGRHNSLLFSPDSACVSHRQALRLLAKMDSLGLLAAYKYLGPTKRIGDEKRLRMARG